MSALDLVSKFSLSQIKTEIGEILTLDANSALSVGSMAFEAAANAFFLREK